MNLKLFKAFKDAISSVCGVWGGYDMVNIHHFSLVSQKPKLCGYHSNGYLNVHLTIFHFSHLNVQYFNNFSKEEKSFKS